MNHEPFYLTRGEAANLLGLREQTLANWAWQGVGPPYIRINARCVRYPRDEILTWAAAHLVRPHEAEACNQSSTGNGSKTRAAGA